MAADASGPKALKWIFNVQGGVTANPTVAPTDGTVYISTVSVDSESKENSYFLHSLTPGQGGGEATENWNYSFGSAAVTTSPALSTDETIIYLTSNFKNKADLESISTAQLTALDKNTEKPAKTFNDGKPVILRASIIGAPKVVPVTDNIIVNTFDRQGIHVNQNLRVYHAKDGSMAICNPLFSLDAPASASATWLDFEHREPVLNGHDGAAQIVNNKWLSRDFHLVNYWHVNTGLHDDSELAEWALWNSKIFCSASSTPLPHLVVSIRHHRLYFVEGSVLFAYEDNGKSNKGSELWKKDLAPSQEVNLNATAPIIATKDSANPKSVVAQAGILYLGGTNGHVYGVYLGKTTAIRIFDWPISKAALDKGMIIDNDKDILYVVDAKGALFALDLEAESNKKPAILWQIDDAGITTAPVVFTKDGSVVVGSISSDGSNQVKAYIGGRGNA